MESEIVSSKKRRPQSRLSIIESIGSVSLINLVEVCNGVNSISDLFDPAISFADSRDPEWVSEIEN